MCWITADLCVELQRIYVLDYSGFMCWITVDLCVGLQRIYAILQQLQNRRLRCLEYG